MERRFNIVLVNCQGRKNDARQPYRVPQVFIWVPHPMFDTLPGEFTEDQMSKFMELFKPYNDMVLDENRFLAQQQLIALFATIKEKICS